MVGNAFGHGWIPKQSKKTSYGYNPFSYAYVGLFLKRTRFVMQDNLGQKLCYMSAGISFSIYSIHFNILEQARVSLQNWRLWLQNRWV